MDQQLADASPRTPQGHTLGKFDADSDDEEMLKTAAPSRCQQPAACQGKIDTLKAQAAELKKARMKVTRDLRNARRRASRLKKKARALSSGDLTEILALKAHQAEAARRGRRARHHPDGEAAEQEPSGVPVAPCHACCACACRLQIVPELCDHHCPASHRSNPGWLSARAA